METKKKTGAVEEQSAYVRSTPILITVIVMWLSVCGVVIMCIFPPWIAIYTDSDTKIENPEGYHIIFNPPAYSNRNVDIRINFERLGEQCVPVLVITTVMYLIQANNKKKWEQKK